jgi:hypothetical protein
MVNVTCTSDGANRSRTASPVRAKRVLAGSGGGAGRGAGKSTQGQIPRESSR